MRKKPWCNHRLDLKRENEGTVRENLNVVCDVSPSLKAFLIIQKLTFPRASARWILGFRISLNVLWSRVHQRKLIFGRSLLYLFYQNIRFNSAFSWIFNKTEFERLSINNFTGLKISRRWPIQEPLSDPIFSFLSRGNGEGSVVPRDYYLLTISWSLPTE